MADIGDKLRSAREAKGLSIADIEKATKIQSRYLTAIEQDEFDKLPGDFYVRAFIRQYAQIVGLNGKELLNDAHKDVPKSKPEQYVKNSIDNKSQEVRQTTNNKQALWRNYLPRIAVGVGVIVVILIIYMLYARLSAGNSHPNSSSNVAVSRQGSSSKTHQGTAGITSNPVRITKVGNNEYRVIGLKANRKLVIRAGNQTITASVALNGQTQWQQSLNSKQQHQFKLGTNVKTIGITLSNDLGTAVTIGGKRIPYKGSGNYRSLTLLIGKSHHQVKPHSSHTSSSSGNGNNSNENNSSNNSSNYGNSSSGSSGNRSTNNTVTSTKHNSGTTNFHSSQSNSNQSSNSSVHQSNQNQSNFSQKQSSNNSGSSGNVNNNHNGGSGNSGTSSDSGNTNK